MDFQVQATQVGESTSAQENMKKYMDSHCITLEVPSLYVQDAKFFVKDPRYCIKILNLVHPKHRKSHVVPHRLQKFSS